MKAIGYSYPIFIKLYKHIIHIENYSTCEVKLKKKTNIEQ